jgi:outer membrane protein insertion porin family
LPFENYAPAAAPLQTRLTSTAQTASAGLSSATSQAPTGAASGPSFIVRPANANSFSTPSPEPPGDFAGWEWKVWSPSPNWPSDFQPRSLLARKNELPRSIVFRGQDPGYGNPAGQGGFNPQNPGSVAPPPAPGSIPGGGLLGGQPMPPYAGGPAGPSASVYDPPDTAIPIDVYATETQTGRFMFGAGVNSNAGLIGNITIDEQNFDWTKVPTSWEELRSGRAWRGAGQRFNISMAPGTIVQNYSVNFAEPYLLDTPVGFSIGGNYFNRYYQNWTETRAGGRLSLMYQFTPDLSGSIAFSGYDVKISNPSNPQEPELARVLGWSTLLGATASMTYDTRDSTFLATEGYYIGLSAEQAFGTFVFPRATADVRRYIKLHERPDGSGRHVVMLAGLFGIEGNNAPLYEHFFAGGIGSIRGFYFRGASTVDQGVIVGGTSQALGTVEYLFPLTADDMLRGTIFCDAGVIENGFDYAPGSLRVAPGAGLLIAVPALGPAPINVGIAIPVVRNPNDMLQYFYFSMGFGR